MTSILEPKTTLAIVGAEDLAVVQDRRVLFVGQKLAGGNAVSGVLLENLNGFSDAELNALFGQGSFIVGMLTKARQMLSRITPQPQIDVIPLADGAGTKADCIITFSGAATENGELEFQIASKKDFTFTLPITASDTPTQLGDKLETLINANLDAPFTSINAAGVVTIEARHFGTTPNFWGIGATGAVAGVTAATTAWSNGTGDPSLTGVLDAVDDVRETTIIWPEVYDISVVADFLDARFNAAQEIFDGVAVSVRTGTATQLKAAVAPLNSQSVAIFGNTFDNTGGFTDKKGPGVFEIADNLASGIGIIRALRLTQDATLTNFIDVTGAPNDAFGGIHISSLPYHNTRLPNFSIPAPGEYFNRIDQNDLSNNGVSMFGANRANNALILGQVVTTSLTDNAGNPDTSFKFLNTVDQATLLREFFVNNFQERYRNTRLTDGAVVIGFGMQNKETITGFCIRLYQELAADTVTQAGNDALADYKTNLTVVLDTKNGKVTINQAPLLVSQLRIIIGTIQIKFAS